MADTEPPPLKKTHLTITELNVESQQSKHYSFIPHSIYVRLEQILGLYGHFCATHAWETICTIVTLTICVVSCSLLRAIPRETRTNNDDTDVEEVGSTNMNYSIFCILYVYYLHRVCCHSSPTVWHLSTSTHSSTSSRSWDTSSHSLLLEYLCYLLHSCSHSNVSFYLVMLFPLVTKLCLFSSLSQISAR